MTKPIEIWIDAIDFEEKGGWKEALKYAPIAQWKDWGYFESNTGRTVRQMILGQETKLGKLREFSMALAGTKPSGMPSFLQSAPSSFSVSSMPQM